MTKNFTRADRLEEQILKDVADIIYHEVKDPRLGYITVTDVEVSKDLKHATVYYTVLEDKDKISTQDALESSKGFIRSALAKRLTMYQVPDLSFKYDTSIERGANISNLIDQINQKDKQQD
ncbi:30S ribosome-binding factor RbfA [Neisseriaceae bacterium PsAf]|nr:30S ribosome-binding factor RbfA [Neisseriaceae bacterium PsAf]MCV2502995.1 30S ribosome-binding factor RbfA [Neisseriaceae bacterium]